MSNVNINISKPIIAMDISSSKRGGPYIVVKNIIDSSLSNFFEFKTIEYNINLGRFISWKRILDIKKQIKNINPNIILINGLQLSCFHVSIAAKLAGIKSRVITIHGSSLESTSISTLKKILLFFIEFFSLWMCTSFYGVSKYSSKLSATKFFQKKNKGFIYNFNNKFIPQKIIKRDSLGFSNDDIIIVSSGRITKEKGFHILKDTIKAINNSKVKFLILGDGEYLDEMRSELIDKKLNGQVVFTGFVSNVKSYLDISDIFVLPTLHETLSLSLLEAGASGLPLISCNVGGVPEVISNNYNGILIEPNNDLALTNAISSLIVDPQKRKEMGNNARLIIMKKFSREKSLTKLSNLFNEELQRQV